jgi:hypothetical protein
MFQITSTEVNQELFDIEVNLNILVKKIEVLNYINPSNSERDKK